MFLRALKEQLVVQKAHAASPQLCFEHYFASQQNVDVPQTCVCTRQAQYASRCVLFHPLVLRSV